MDREAFGKRTDEVILDYVIAVLNEHGEAGVRVGDVARETGTSTSSIYHYFNNREGLIAAAEVERYSRGLVSFADGTHSQMSRVNSKEGFHDLVLATHRATYSADYSSRRLTLLNALGSVLGRPLLMEKLAGVEEGIVVRYAEIFREPQERGWIRPDVDLAALSAWMMGHLLGRVLIEIGQTSVAEEEWNRIADVAVLAVFFGETSGVADAEAGSTSGELGSRHETPQP